MVDQLIMLGTPNGGSPFGSIPEYIEMFTTLVTVAINFGKPFLAPLVTYLTALEKANKVLKATKYLTVTLDQMNAESDFIKKLHKNKKPATPYYAIAGDINKYASEQDTDFGNFVDKVLLKIGNVMNHSFPNDVAVEVEQILAIPNAFNAEKYVVTGHHINYFVEGEAMEKLKELYQGFYENA